MSAILVALLAGVLAACAGMGFPAEPDSADPGAATPVSVNADLPLARSTRFEALSVEEGLSESVVNDIVQDRTGYLWFTTEDGLNRYDGYAFTIYRHDPQNFNSLSHSNTTRIIEDRQGRLWIGTLNAGLNRFDPATGKFTHYKHKNKQAGSLSSNNITALLEDHEGAIWVGTMTGGLNRYNPQTDDFTYFQNNADDPDSLLSNEILDLLETRDGTLWVGTVKGLDRLDRTTGHFIHYHKKSGDPGGLSSDYAYRLADDGQGRVWVGAAEGSLDRLDPRTGRVTRFLYDPVDPKRLPGDRITTLMMDRAGFLWVGFYGYGLCRMDPDEVDFICYRHDPAKGDSLSVDHIASLYEDRSGILWIGTFGGGVNKLDPGYKPFVNLVADPDNPVHLSGGVIFAVYQDPQEYLWIGSGGSGLDRVDRKTGRVTNFRNNPADPMSLSGNVVTAIFMDREGELWVGTYSGLNRMDSATGKFTRYEYDPADPSGLSDNVVAGIREDSEGNLWVATRKGLHRFDRMTGVFTRYQNKPGNPGSLASKMISCLYIDSGGFLWVGTGDKGVDRFDPRTEKVIHFPSNPDDPKSLSDTYVMSIFEDSRGTIWIGTIGGLNRLVWSDDHTSGTFQHYRVQDGLPNDFIYATQEDSQGRLWISTNKGLSRFDTQAGIFTNFDVRDGLQSNEFDMGASFKTAEGEMIFGGIRGVTIFRPEEILDNPYVPPVVLTTLIQHGERIDTGTNQVRDITLRWPDNYFDFEFAALNYIRPENNQYAYRLEGFDRDWNMTGTSRSGRYTNLPGGTYTLHLKGSNNDGVWNEAGAAFQVHVIPPFWATWWFRGVFVLVLVGGVMGGVRLRVRSIESRNQELERLVQARTREIQKLYEQTRELAVVEERNRLARDLHDSAKQKAFAALAQLGAANGLIRTDPPRAHSALREAETLVYEVIEELTFLIQEMYPAALKEKGLAAVLREYIFEWESRSDIRVDYRIENEYPLELKFEQALYRLTQEALANVARHSQASQVEIAVVYGPDQITISIADDGQGFDMNRRPAGVGLRSMQERIAMIGGKLMIESAPGKGTRLFASAPIPRS